MGQGPYKTVYQFKDGTGQNKAFTSGASAAIDTAFGNFTRTILVWVTADAYIDIGASPTAATTGYALPANQQTQISVAPAQKIAFRGVSGSGTAFVVEVN